MIVIQKNDCDDNSSSWEMAPNVLCDACTCDVFYTITACYDTDNDDEDDGAVLWRVEDVSGAELCTEYHPFISTTARTTVPWIRRELDRHRGFEITVTDQTSNTVTDRQIFVFHNNEYQPWYRGKQSYHILSPQIPKWLRLRSQQKECESVNSLKLSPR